MPRIYTVSIYNQSNPEGKAWTTTNEHRTFQEWYERHAKEGCTVTIGRPLTRYHVRTAYAYHPDAEVSAYYATTREG